MIDLRNYFNTFHMHTSGIINFTPQGLSGQAVQDSAKRTGVSVKWIIQYGVVIFLKVLRFELMLNQRFYDSPQTSQLNIFWLFNVITDLLPSDYNCDVIRSLCMTHPTFDICYYSLIFQSRNIFSKRWRSKNYRVTISIK